MQESALLKILEKMKLKEDKANEANISITINGKNATPLVPVTPNAVATRADTIEDTKRGITDMRIFTTG